MMNESKLLGRIVYKDIRSGSMDLKTMKPITTRKIMHKIIDRYAKIRQLKARIRKSGNLFL